LVAASYSRYIALTRSAANTGMFGRSTGRTLANGIILGWLMRNLRQAPPAPPSLRPVLRQIVGVRAALDQALAPEVVHRLTGETASELHGLCDRMRQAAPRGEDFAEADRSFHLLLGKTLGNPLHGQLIAAFWDVHTIVTPGLGIGTTRDTVDSARAHLKIVEAAVAGDLEGYRAAVDAHYAPLLRALDTSEKQEPGDNDTLDAP